MGVAWKGNVENLFNDDGSMNEVFFEKLIKISYEIGKGSIESSV